MSFKTFSKMAAAFIFSLSAGASVAGPIVWDYSPITTNATIGSNNYSNNLAGQHFAEKVSFLVDTMIVGMDIYMGSRNVKLNDMATISIYKNKANAPGLQLGAFQSIVSEIDNVGATSGNKRVHVDFGGFKMLAGEAYWIGMAPTSVSWTQTSLRGVSGGNNSMAQFNGAPYAYMTNVGDMAFRLHGADVKAVPEPASIALLGLGLLGVAAARRRRQK